MPFLGSLIVSPTGDVDLPALVQTAQHMVGGDGRNIFESVTLRPDGCVEFVVSFANDPVYGTRNLIFGLVDRAARQAGCAGSLHPEDSTAHAS